MSNVNKNFEICYTSDCCGEYVHSDAQICPACLEHCEVVEDFLAIDCTEEEVADKAGLFARQYFIDMEEQLILSPEIDVYEVDFDGHQFKATTDNICWQSFCISRADAVFFSTKSAYEIQCKITTAEKLLSPFFDKIERAQRQNQF